MYVFHVECVRSRVPATRFSFMGGQKDVNGVEGCGCGVSGVPLPENCNILMEMLHF